MSTELESNPNWKELNSFSFKYFSQPFLMNNDEFMVALCKSNYVNGDGIYKFNIHKNEWIKIFDYEENFKCDMISAAYDNKQKLLHVGHYDYPSKMFTFDLQTKTKMPSMTPSNSSYFEIIIVDNKLHQICSNGNHYIYDKTKTFQKITTFKSFDGLINYRSIHLKSLGYIFIFGGWKTNSLYQNSIYQFSHVDSKWKELNIKMTIRLASIGLVATKNEQYVIILGGRTAGNAHSDDILVYNAKNNIINKSKTKCPEKGTYNAIIINNSKRDEITSFGFVNDCYKTEYYVGMQLLHQNLIKIICCYFCNEYMYLLKRENGKHWKINLDYVLQSST